MHSAHIVWTRNFKPAIAKLFQLSAILKIVNAREDCDRKRLGVVIPRRQRVAYNIFSAIFAKIGRPFAADFGREGNPFLEVRWTEERSEKELTFSDLSLFSPIPGNEWLSRQTSADSSAIFWRKLQEKNNTSNSKKASDFALVWNQLNGEEWFSRENRYSERYN